MQFEILNASIENAHSLGRSGKLINLKYTNTLIMQFMAARRLADDDGDDNLLLISSQVRAEFNNTW
jgi:hypothetical protein